MNRASRFSSCPCKHPKSTKHAWQTKGTRVIPLGSANRRGGSMSFHKTIITAHSLKKVSHIAHDLSFTNLIKNCMICENMFPSFPRLRAAAVSDPNAANCQQFC
ncbi:hypothetical protein L596_001723 [Steinernema carpocapsae]|uniref:Uncharacterized protein n=1 Tax=Steinernema carpocapsae TaxID=34508 RepID=A0A4U8UN31_STECR|nr:hypothetical protein L596_001723 [Steinernema carpocapsae]